MKNHFRTSRILTIFFLMITALIYQNFAYSEGWRINNVVINEKTRTAHARELLGNRYEGSTAQILEKSNSLSMGVFNEIYRRLPTAYKAQAVDLSSTLLQEAEKYEVDPVFVLAVIITESSFNPKARGQFGEIGLMQIKPDTAQWIAKKYRLAWEGPKTLENPANNVKIGMAYFNYLRSKFDGHANKYVSAYNMGARRVHLMYADDRTPREYSLRVMKNYNLTYRHLATTTILSLLADN